MRRHQEIWPEMVEALRSAGISNYSIFRHGLTLFGYFETGDLKKTQEYLANSATNQRWSEWMDPIMKVDVDPTTQFPISSLSNGTWIELTPGRRTTPRSGARVSAFPRVDALGVVCIVR